MPAGRWRRRVKANALKGIDRPRAPILNVAREVAALEWMTVGQLQDRYVEVFGEAVRSRHRQYLIRRIAWRLQANAEGGLSERALRRAEELANLADARVMPPRAEMRGGSTNPNGALRSASSAPPPVATIDPRLPAPGNQITRKYKGRTIAVTVLADGLEYLGERYKSLSAVAKTITGSHMNGFRFFGLEGRS
ncbi:MAG: DUF2924 domain-containing protein [Phycisphaerales bacterium]|nr:DUF2924 domain-containing protein [Phycisphaerales bacterium]